MFMEKDGEGQRELFRILTVYASCNPEVRMARNNQRKKAKRCTLRLNFTQKRAVIERQPRKLIKRKRLDRAISVECDRVTQKKAKRFTLHSKLDMSGSVIEYFGTDIQKIREMLEQMRASFSGC